ncbi:unnamed protein product, partial [Ectocarpus sp. 12 AP-2014]
NASIHDTTHVLQPPCVQGRHRPLTQRIARKRGWKMDKSSTRDHVEIAVDTSKFESWPLLKPDELATTPTNVLQASAKDLNVMCRQVAGRDPVTDYARRQHERTTTILLERAAHVRVRALLAGTEFVCRDSLINHGAPATSPPEDEKANDVSSIRALAEEHARLLKDRSSGRCMKGNNTDDNLVVRCGVGPIRGDNIHVARHSLRSPQRMKSSRGPSIVFPISNSALVGKDEDDVE